MIDRREVLRGGAALVGAAALGAGERLRGDAGRPQRVVVVGAGVFGVFTALALRDRGVQVTLLDPWGAGNARSSSGGETRVIRGAYGPDPVYTRLAVDAFERWAAFERRVGRTFLHPTGALWMVATEDDSFLRGALPVLRDAGLAVSELTPSEAARRWPQIRFDGVRWVLHEERAGFLLARRACAAAAEALAAAGGEVRAVAAASGAAGPELVDAGARATALRLADGGTVAADQFVFACGPWLPKLFPELLGAALRPTRQDVLFFGTPRDDRRFEHGALPVWIEWSDRLIYGIPGNEARGFKVADDTRGEPFDPTEGDRRVLGESVERARELLARRFPALAGAPLVETRVCQYENTPDHDFLLDRHPERENVWIVGGGSGHGFKFGPAWGERAAATILGERPVEGKFGLARLARPLPG